jgi:formate transporter
VNAGVGHARHGKRQVQEPISHGGFDAYSPKEIAGRVEAFSIVKAQLPLLSLWLLGMLAGAFIGLGALAYTLVASDGSLGFVASRFVGGIAFCLGLMLVTIAGAELFTGNIMLVMAWADGRVDAGQVLRNWIVVFIANLAGCIGLAILLWLSGSAALNDGLVGRAALRIAIGKVQLQPTEAFVRGVLCNALVCVSVWMAYAGRSVTDKVVAIVFPVTAFVAAGFEHSIANMYFFALAMLLGAPIGIADALHNLVPVIAGNIVGGSMLVALVYFVIYVRGGSIRNSRPAALNSPETAP